jgi:hypothetical protein
VTNALYFYWAIIGCELVYDNLGIQSCIQIDEANEMRALVAIAQLILLLDFFVILFSVLVCPVIVFSFFKVLRQRWRIYKFEKIRNKPVSKEDLEHAQEQLKEKRFPKLHELVK